VIERGAATREAEPVDPDRSTATWRRRLPLALLTLASIAFLVLGWFEARTDSPTYDEPVYVASGVAAVLHQNLEFNAEHPPLPKVLAALPVLAAHPVVPPTIGCKGNGERVCSAQFAQAQASAGRLRRVTFAARLVPLVETVGVALVVYALAAELFGAAAGALAGLLWLASPLTLAIGHLDGTDIPLALTIALSSWALARWLRVRTVRALVWTGVAFAATAGTSISGALVVIAGLAVILGVSWRSGVRRAFGYAALVAVVTWIGVWVPYIVLDPSVLTHPTVIAPKPYLDGLSYLASYNASHQPGYLIGVAYTGGRWWFWPLSLVVKYPAPILLLLLGGTVAWFWAERAARWRSLLAVILPAVVIAAFTVASPLNIGVRLLLPATALWGVIASALVPVLQRLAPAWRRGLAAAASVLVALALAATSIAFPTSLAWTAWPFTPGYAEATDSNVDWGQGLYALQSWSGGHQPWVAYFGPRGLGVADVPGARPLLGTAPDRVTGWVAVSASALTGGDRSELAWLRNYCPVRVLAGSILVYRFAQPPVVGPAPARPATECAGPYSTRVAGN
jgi:hypothetical protein